MISVTDALGAMTRWANGMLNGPHKQITYCDAPLDQLVVLPADAADGCDSDSGQWCRYGNDAVGDHVEAETPAGLRRFSYDVSDRLVAIEGEAGIVEVTQDANGDCLDDELKDVIDGAMSMLSGDTSSADRHGVHRHAAPRHMMPCLPMGSERAVVPK